MHDGRNWKLNNKWGTAALWFVGALILSVPAGYYGSAAYEGHKKDLMRQGEDRLLKFSCEAWCLQQYKSKKKHYEPYPAMACTCEDGQFGEYHFGGAFLEREVVPHCDDPGHCPFPPDWDPEDKIKEKE